MHNISIPQSAIERGRVFHPQKTIDPKRTAVVAIDFQRFFIDADHPMGNVHARDIMDNANRVHASVRDAGGLVVFTQHSAAPLSVGGVISTPEPRASFDLFPGSPSYELHPAIQRASGDSVVVKHQSSPLHPRAGTRLNELLQAHRIETLIVTGLVTNGCCESTVRDAFQHGYSVIIASDATAAMTDEEHNAALLNLSIYYADAMTAESIAAALLKTEQAHE